MEEAIKEIEAMIEMHRTAKHETFKDKKWNMFEELASHLIIEGLEMALEILKRRVISTAETLSR